MKNTSTKTKLLASLFIVTFSVVSLLYIASVYEYYSISMSELFLVLIIWGIGVIGFSLLILIVTGIIDIDKYNNGDCDCIGESGCACDPDH